MLFQSDSVSKKKSNKNVFKSNFQHIFKRNNNKHCLYSLVSREFYIALCLIATVLKLHNGYFVAIIAERYMLGRITQKDVFDQTIRCATLKKGPYAICGSAHAIAHTDPGLQLPANSSNGYCSICQRSENVQIRLHGCVPSSIFSLIAWFVSNLRNNLINTFIYQTVI